MPPREANAHARGPGGWRGPFDDVQLPSPWDTSRLSLACLGLVGRGGLLHSEPQWLWNGMANTCMCTRGKPALDCVGFLRTLHDMFIRLPTDRPRYTKFASEVAGAKSCHISIASPDERQQFPTCNVHAFALKNNQCTRRVSVLL